MRYKQLFFAAAILAAPTAFGITATKEYVDRKDGEIAAAATNYTDSAISQIPAPDFSPSNATLVATIEATAPAPGDYAAVSNAAVYAAITNALQDVAIESNRVNMASNRVAISTLSDSKLDKSGGDVTGDIRMPNGILDAGDVQTRSMFDFLQPDQPTKSLDAPENSGKALTDADISDSSSALGAALAGKLSTSGGTMTGGIAFGTEDDYGYLGLAYDDETHRLRIIDVWNENIAYLEVPNACDGDRVAFTRNIDAAISGKQDNLPYPTNAIPYAAISGKPNLATVATSGSYNDLSNVPDVPSLAGHTYDFATNIGLYTAVRDIILALGGSVTNFPAIPQN